RMAALSAFVAAAAPARGSAVLVVLMGMVPIRNPLSSPALSLDRLRIEVRGARPVLISPADRAAFLADLEAGRGAVDLPARPGRLPRRSRGEARRRNDRLGGWRSGLVERRVVGNVRDWPE